MVAVRWKGMGRWRTAAATEKKIEDHRRKSEPAKARTDWLVMAVHFRG